MEELVKKWRRKISALCYLSLASSLTGFTLIFVGFATQNPVLTRWVWWPLVAAGFIMSIAAVGMISGMPRGESYRGYGPEAEEEPSEDEELPRPTSKTWLEDPDVKTANGVVIVSRGNATLNRPAPDAKNGASPNGD